MKRPWRAWSPEKEPPNYRYLALCCYQLMKTVGGRIKVWGYVQCCGLHRFDAIRIRLSILMRIRILPKVLHMLENQNFSNILYSLLKFCE